VSLKDFLELIKVRILVSSLLTTFFGYAIALPIHEWNGSDVFWCLLGSGFIFSAAAALNHVLESDFDQLMDRTKMRPLPTGRVLKSWVIVGVISFLLLGSVILFLKSTGLVLINGLLVFLLYDFVYTPLKRYSSVNTLVGAIPGAMPLLSGWFVVHSSFSFIIVLLFLMLYLWQLPHFYSIAWIYRKSYEDANLIMISTNDSTGKRTQFYLGISSIFFVISTYLPLLYNNLGGIYIYIITIMNLYLLVYVFKFIVNVDDKIAKKVLLVTIFYPPLIPIVYILGKMIYG